MRYHEQNPANQIIDTLRRASFPPHCSFFFAVGCPRCLFHARLSTMAATFPLTAPPIYSSYIETFQGCLLVGNFKFVLWGQPGTYPGNTRVRTRLYSAIHPSIPVDALDIAPEYTRVHTRVCPGLHPSTPGMHPSVCFCLYILGVPGYTSECTRLYTRPYPGMNPSTHPGIPGYASDYTRVCTRVHPSMTKTTRILVPGNPIIDVL